MKSTVIFGLFLLSHNVFALEGFPSGCQPVAVKDAPLILTTAKPPVVVLIHNLASSEVWITHPGTDAGAGAGWSSKLQGGNWSALTLQNESFELSCIESKPGHEQQIPCAGVLAICQWPGVTVPKREGTYWAGEDLSLAALKAHLGGRGFVFPTTP